MAETWQTVEQAAVSLGMSVRTVNRHISAGKIDSRLQDGRREVLIDLPEPQPEMLRAAVKDAFAKLNAAALDEDVEEIDFSQPVPFEDELSGNRSAAVSDVESSVRTQAHVNQVNVPPTSQSSDRQTGHSGYDAQTVLALADNASDKAELAVTAYQTLARLADVRMEASRRSARFAWAAVALMAVGVTAAVGWTTYHLTRAQDEVGNLKERLSVTSATVSDVQKERDSLRSDLINAREQAARTEGKLDAATQAMARIEATPKAAPALVPAPIPVPQVAVTPVEPPKEAKIDPATQPSPVEQVKVAPETELEPASVSPTTKPSFFQRFSKLWDDQ